MTTASAREAVILRALATRVDADDAEAQNNLGALLVARGLVREGADAFVAARRRDPSLTVALRNLEVAVAQSGELAARAEALRSAAFADPERRDGWLALARWHAALAHEAEALEAADSLLALDPTDAEASALAIAVLLDAGRPDDAAARAQAAVAHAPLEARWRRLLAHAQYHGGRYADALASCQDALRCDPDDADAQLLQAFVLGDLGRTDEARRALRTAVLLQPSLGRTEPNRALDDYDARRFESLAPGRQAARRSGRMFVPVDTVPAAHTIGVAARALGFGAAATASFRVAATGDAAAPSIEALAELALDAGDPAEALGRVEALLADAPGRASLWNARGVALHHLGRLDEAETSYRRAGAGAGTEAVATNNLAVVLAQTGRVRDALVTLLPLVAAPSPSRAARLNVARLFAQGAHPAQALPHYQGLLAEDPQDAEAWRGAATVLARLGRLEEARTAGTRLVHLRPGDAAARAELDDVRVRLGEVASALDEPPSAGSAATPPAFWLLTRRAGGVLATLPATAVEPEAVHSATPPFRFDPSRLDVLFAALRSPRRAGTGAR